MTPLEMRLLFLMFACWFGAVISLGWSLVVHDARHVLNPGVIIFGGAELLLAATLIASFGYRMFRGDLD